MLSPGSANCQEPAPEDDVGVLERHLAAVMLDASTLADPSSTGRHKVIHLQLVVLRFPHVLPCLEAFPQSASQESRRNFLRTTNSITISTMRAYPRRPKKLNSGEWPGGRYHTPDRKGSPPSVGTMQSSSLQHMERAYEAATYPGYHVQAS